jgi:hypothetical protein
MWKEAVLPSLRYLSTFLVELRKTVNNLSTEPTCGPDLNPGPTKREAGILGKNSVLYTISETSDQQIS